MAIVNMVQYGVFPNCSNQCEFCLLRDKGYYSKERVMYQLEAVKRNIDVVDWKHKFSNGISLIGGEIYYMQDKDYQDSFMELIDIIIEKVLKVSDNPDCKYSSVTNGIYDPAFLYRVINRIVEKVGIKYVDLNFSYDFKYRYRNDHDRELALRNIINFCRDFKYIAAVQMILTQNVIEMAKDGFNTAEFERDVIPGAQLVYLYPHKPNTQIKLDKFFLNREDFLWYLSRLQTENPRLFMSFTSSANNSQSFKYTGLSNRDFELPEDIYCNQQPIMYDGKNLRDPKCGHSILYRTYVDSKSCMLCDIMNSGVIL
jgi:hypothetical protein